jgi:hypothetical protein
VNVVVLFELFVEVRGIEILVMGPIEPEDGLDLGEGRSFRAWRFHAPVEDAVVAELFVV